MLKYAGGLKPKTFLKALFKINNLDLLKIIT